MGKYIAKRIGYMALVFLIVSFLMYSLYNLIPTDPARAELEAQKQSLKPAEYEQLYQELRAKMGLDDPLVIRYMRWMGLWPDVGDNTGFNGLLQGNFGYSQFYKKDVTEVIVDPMKNTIFINIFSTILALGVTIPLGIFCAVHKGKKVDNTVQVVTMLGYSLPIYIIALIFMFFFCVLWRIFPISGTKTAGAIYATKWDEFIDMLYHVTLPVIVMTFASLGGMTRYVRSAMIDALSMDYIRTARAKGVAERMVILKHGLRNAILPVVTYLGTLIANLLTGSFIVERLFAIPGLGKYFVDSITARDYNIIMGVTIFLGVFVVACNLIVDVVYGVIDPRVKLDE